MPAIVAGLDVRLHDRQRIASFRKQPIEINEYQSVDGVSDTTGNTAVVVKLFRVFLLLPVVLGIGWYFTRQGLKHGEARLPVPAFAIVFLVLCALNSAAPLAPSLMTVYEPVKSVLTEISTGGLLLAIGALGLGTSVPAIVELGWRHIITVLSTSLVILVIVTGGLVLMELS